MPVHSSSCKVHVPPSPAPAALLRPAMALAALLVLLPVLIGTGPAQAHFDAGSKLRTIEIDRTGGTLRVRVTVPAPLVFSDLIGRAQVDQLPLTSPFLVEEATADGSRLRLDRTATESRSAAFRERLRRALVFSQAGLDLHARVTGFRFVTPAGSAPPQAGNEAGVGADPPIGEVVIGYDVILDSADPPGSLQVRSGYAPLITGPEVSIDNHFIDARLDPPLALSVPGQLETPVTLDGSRLTTFLHFVRQGMVHILEGLDHVLLVVALALGVSATRRLILLVTAFTAGHSLTLIATFLGATPDWPWFSALVETAIAASVIYAAGAAMARKAGSAPVFAGIGLLHGLGFAFVLGEILGRDAPDLVPALLAFNIGIELGQVLILTLCLTTMTILVKLLGSAVSPVRLAVLAAIVVTATVWMTERLAGIGASA